MVTSNTQGKATPKGKQAQPALRPFITGSRFADDIQYDQTQTLDTSTHVLPTCELDTDGYTAGLYILAECTAVNTQASTATFLEDSPFRVFETVNLKDTNNKDILGPMNGHDLYIAVKYGGYHFVDDAKASPIYSVTSGSGTTGGTFTFILYLPIEIVHRDGLGSLTNKSSSSVFKLNLTTAATTSVWSGTTGAPATSASLRVRVGQFGWMDSDGRDIKGNSTAPEPPAVNTVQFWDKQTFTFSSGSMQQRLASFSGGLRTIIFEMRDSAGSRTGHEADWPDPFTFNVDKTTLIDRLRTVWRHIMGEDYGLWNGLEVVPGVSGTAVTEGHKRDYGTYPVSWAKDYGLQPGGENRFGYLWVSSATALVLKGSVGTTGTSHTFNVLLNYVNPANGDPRTLTGGR
jgi:hypothetical protein